MQNQKKHYKTIDMFQNVSIQVPLLSKDFFLGNGDHQEVTTTGTVNISAHWIHRLSLQGKIKRDNDSGFITVKFYRHFYDITLDMIGKKIVGSVVVRKCMIAGEPDRILFDITPNKDQLVKADLKMRFIENSESGIPLPGTNFAVVFEKITRRELAPIIN